MPMPLTLLKLVCNLSLVDGSTSFAMNDMASANHTSGSAVDTPSFLLTVPQKQKEIWRSWEPARVEQQLLKRPWISFGFTHLLKPLHQSWKPALVNGYSSVRVQNAAGQFFLQQLFKNVD
jgi:hypothetical protein